MKMIRAIVASIITSTLLLSPFFATSVLSLTLVQNLTSRAEQQCILTLEADGNGQTYIVCKNGYKYPTGQVSRETGEALAVDNMWIGMTGTDLATIPTRGTVYQHPTLAGELPETLHNELPPVDQGLTNMCVAFTYTRIASALTGQSFSPEALHEAYGGTDVGISAFKALNHVEEYGIGGERFKVHTVAGWYTGTEPQVASLKRAIMEYGYLAANLDTVRNWDRGAEYPEGRDYTVNHTFTIAGWDEDGWIVYNSYGEGAGTLRYDYPLLWVHAFEWYN